MIRFGKKTLKNKKGFTLIELIVVIAVLGILATIAIPKLTGYTDDAEKAVTDANERILEQAAASWYATTDEDDIPSEGEEWTGDTGQNWEDYFDEWPEGIDSVTIDEDGNITIDRE